MCERHYQLALSKQYFITMSNISESEIELADFTNLSKSDMTDIRGISLEVSGFSAFQQDDRLVIDILVLQSVNQSFTVQSMQLH